MPTHHAFELQGSADVVAQNLRAKNAIYTMRRRKDILQEPNF